MIVAAFLHDDSGEIEGVLLGGFDDWHADLSDDRTHERKPGVDDPAPGEVP